jgi:hypothetical protein
LSDDDASYHVKVAEDAGGGATAGAAQATPVA